MSKYDTVVIGKVVRPDGVIPDGSVAIKNGKIVAVGIGEDTFSADQVIEKRNCFILPGAIDAHVHSLGEAKEGYLNSTKAAAAGGICTIVDHPLDLGGAPVGAKGLLDKKARAEKEAYVDFALLAGVTPELIDKIEDCTKVEVPGFKMLMHDTAPETMPYMRDGELLEAFSRIAPTGLFAGVHAENEDIIRFNIAKLKRAKKTYPKAHCESRPEVSETEAVNRACELAINTRCRLHIFHVSVPRSFDIIARARQDFPAITGETAPHYLVMNDSEMERQGAFAKINPPLRPEASRLKLWEKVQQGLVSFIASDHAPHSNEGKIQDDFFEIQSGAPAVETMLPLIFDEGVVKKRISIEHFSTLFATNLAQLLGLYPQKGLIAPGFDADLVIFDPEKRWTIHAKDLHYAVGWTPYEGKTITGKPVLTMVRGMVVCKDGEIVGTSGYGRFVPSNTRKQKGAK